MECNEPDVTVSKVYRAQDGTIQVHQLVQGNAMPAWISCRLFLVWCQEEQSRTPWVQKLMADPEAAVEATESDKEVIRRASSWMNPPRRKTLGHVPVLPPIANQQLEEQQPSIR